MLETILGVGGELESEIARIAPWYQNLEIGVNVTLIVIVVAMIVKAFLARRKQHLGQVGANIAIGVVHQLIQFSLLGTFGLGVLFTIEKAIPWSLPTGVFTWALSFIAADFLYYWMHRIEHRTSLLWQVHAVHHSSPEFDFSTNFRLGWLEFTYTFLFIVPMVLAGFSAVQTVVSFSLVVLYQTWVHTKSIGNLGVIEGVLNTPSAHRVHHAANTIYHDKNYGGVFMVWDRLFDTYEAERQPVVYGVAGETPSANPILINFRGLWNLFGQLKHCSSVAEAGRLLLGTPGYIPLSLRKKNFGP